MCVALVAAVQRALTRIPARDEVGIQHLPLEAARKLAAAAVVGKLSLKEFTKEARGIMGFAAPARGSLEELRATWRLLRAALVSVASPLYSMSEFDGGLLRVDDVLGPTAASTLVDPQHLNVWLKRVLESWENSCVEFRQAGAGQPSLASCVEEHEQYLNWKSTTATVKEELRAEIRLQLGQARAAGRAARHEETGARGRGRGAGKNREPAGRTGPPAELRAGGPHADEKKKSDKERQESAWPDKPRLDAERFKTFKAEVREKCPDVCTQYLIARCTRAECKFKHEVPPAFAAIKQKYANE